MDHKDFEANPGKYRAFKTARVKGHVITENKARDLEAGTIVGLSFWCVAWNQLFRRHEPVYTIKLQNGELWGQMYGSNLEGFVL